MASIGDYELPVDGAGDLAGKTYQSYEQVMADIIGDLNASSSWKDQQNAIKASTSLVNYTFNKLGTTLGGIDWTAVSTPKTPAATPGATGPSTGMTAEQLAQLLATFGAQQQQMFANQQALLDAQKQGQQENAIAILTKTFEQYGLGSLAGVIADLVRKGYSSDTVSLLLQDSDEYKKRFAANEIRRKAGMAVLSPAEYLATERAYRQIMNAAGLPAGFYDQIDDFTNLIGKDISPAELQGRVQTAADAVLNADPFYTQSLRDLYGMTNGDMIAFVLDANRSLPLIQQRANAVAFGAAAQRQGIDNIGVDTAEQYAGLGVGKAQSEQGFAQIATTLPRTEQLGQIYGSDYGQSDALSEVFNNDVQAAQKRRKLVQSETDTFTGSSGVRAGSLASSKQGLI